MLDADLWLTRCPICRRAREGEDEAPCARCGGDLSTIRAAYRGARADVALARRAEAEGDLATARAAAWRALSQVRAATTEALYARVSST